MFLVSAISASSVMFAVVVLGERMCQFFARPLADLIWVVAIDLFRAAFPVNELVYKYGCNH